MIDPDIHRANERRKAIAAALIQLGTALLAASAVKAYYAGTFAFETLGWFAGAIVLIWMGWLILGLLQPEDR